MRTRSAVVLLTCWLAASERPTGTANAAVEPPDSTAGALRFYRAVNPRNFGRWLQALRPPPITPDQHARAVALLPEAGELTPTRDEQAKLSMIEAVLMYHERLQVFETKLIDVPQAFVALYERAVLLISRPALRLVSGTELQALMAHEIGHEYFWADFERTRARGDTRGRQELELKCDGIAVLTIVGLDGDPTRLTTALRRLQRFNEDIGAVANADEYPPLKDREWFVNAVRDRVRPRRPAAAKRDTPGLSGEPFSHPYN